MLALDHKEVLAFASYAPEGRDAEQLAATVGREQGLRLTADVGRRIAELTGGDRSLMANEIEKLCLYLDASYEQPADVTHDEIGRAKDRTQVTNANLECRLLLE